MISHGRPIEGPLPHTPEWEAIRFYDPNRDRPVVFGASEAAGACGVSAYTSLLELYSVKRREKPPADDNEAMEAGRMFEPVVLQLYAKRTGRQLRTGVPMYLHPEQTFMGATPDAIVLPDEDTGVDAKTTTDRRYDPEGEDDDKYGREGTDQLPIEAIFQAQQQMAVMGWESVDFPVLFNIRTCRIYTVHRSDELITAIVSAEKELAERIINGDPPEPDFRHSSTGKLLHAILDYLPGELVELSEEEAGYWADYQRLGAQIKELQEDRDEMRNRILWAMKDAELAVMPSGTKEIRRIQVRGSVWSEKDVAEAQQKLGQVKRKGHQRLLERKRK